MGTCLGKASPFRWRDFFRLLELLHNTRNELLCRNIKYSRHDKDPTAYAEIDSPTSRLKYSMKAIKILRTYRLPKLMKTNWFSVRFLYHWQALTQGVCNLLPQSRRFVSPGDSRRQFVNYNWRLHLG